MPFIHFASRLTRYDTMIRRQVQEGRLCPSANVNVVNVDPFDFNVPELDGDNDAPSPFHFDAGTPPEWVVPHSPGFLAWYQKELGMGVSTDQVLRYYLRDIINRYTQQNLDNVILSDAFCATPPLDQSRAPFQDQAPLDVPTLLRLLEQARAAEALDVRIIRVSGYPKTILIKIITWYSEGK